MSPNRPIALGLLAAGVIIILVWLWTWWLPTLPAGRTTGFLAFHAGLRGDPYTRVVVLDLATWQATPLKREFTGASVDGQVVVTQRARSDKGVPTYSVEAAGKRRPLKLTPEARGSSVSGSGRVRPDGTVGFLHERSFALFDPGQSSPRLIGSLPEGSGDSDLGPVGSRAAVARNGLVQWLDLSTGELTPVDRGETVAVAADGTLAYRRGRRITVLKPGGGQPRVLEFRGRSITGPVWSPDGRYLACSYALGPWGFLSGTSGQVGLGVIEVGTGKTWRVLPITAWGETVATCLWLDDWFSGMPKGMADPVRPRPGAWRTK